MRTIRDEALRNAESLQRSLDSIFLSIGNAYYEANKSLATKASRCPVNVESDKKIRQNRSAFLDSLDQLEIIIMRTTEVLQARARRQHPEIFDTQGRAVVSNHTSGSGREGPSPETMLLNGEGLLPGMQGEVILDPARGSPVAIQDNGTDTNGVSVEIPPTDLDGLLTEANLATEAPVVGSTDINTNEAASALEEPFDTSIQDPNQALDDDLMNLDGPIDFGDMDFDNFKFDDTAHFDFGSMMDD